MFCYTDKHRIPFEIDAADYDIVKRYSWFMAHNGYVTTHPSVIGGQLGHPIHLHVLLLGSAGEGLEWDHDNRMKWDNRRENLHAVTNVVNSRNRGPQANNTYGIKGVNWHRRAKRWRATIHWDGRNIHIGLYDTIEEATEARRDAEEVLWADNKSKEPQS